MHVLDVDPQNLKFEFGRHWSVFQAGNVQSFLALHLRQRIEGWRSGLENSQSWEAVKDLQGRVAEDRALLAVIESQDVTSQVQQAIAFLSKHYGR